MVILSASEFEFFAGRIQGESEKYFYNECLVASSPAGSRFFPAKTQRTAETKLGSLLSAP
jgi:hypothetical protein